MGISDHIALDDLKDGSTHFFEGEPNDMKEIAVAKMGCGHLIIITPPDHPEDDHRDQHTLFLRAQTLEGEETELLFHMGQVGLLHEQTSVVMHNHMLQALKLLDAPDDIVESYTKQVERDAENMEVRRSIIMAAEAAMLVRDAVQDDRLEAVLDSMISDPLIKEVIDLLIGEEDDES